MEGSSVSRSPAQLFDAALNWSGGEDESERWALVRELQQRGDADTFELLVRQVRSGRSDAVALAIHVLGQFDLDGGLRWRTASVELIVSAADTDDPEVVEALVLALGTLADPRGLDTVVRFVDHEDPAVRRAVAVALAKTSVDPLATPGPSALLGLLDDEDPTVRDWATFALGSLTDDDDPAVRDALRARLDDRDATTSGEALVGLARRKDAVVLPLLLELLADPEVGNLAVEAAYEVADPRLLDALRGLERSGWSDRNVRGALLHDAIEACS